MIFVIETLDGGKIDKMDLDTLWPGIPRVSDTVHLYLDGRPAPCEVRAVHWRESPNGGGSVTIYVAQMEATRP